MSQVVEPVDQARGTVLQRPGETEAFVHGNPRDDAWVVFIALDGRGELIHQSLLRLRRVLVKAGHLGPDQEAEPVRPIQPAAVFKFLVLARPVEAQGLRELDVELQRTLIEPGPQLNGGDVPRWQWLEPDRLPDARGGGGEDPFGFFLPRLFAAGQAAIRGRGVGPHDPRGVAPPRPGPRAPA